MALANATEGAVRCTVSKVTRVEPSHGYAARQAMFFFFFGYAPIIEWPSDGASNILATPQSCQDAKELKEKLTAWSLKVAKYEHLFKVMDEAQKTFVVTEMMPKDIKREFLRVRGRGWWRLWWSSETPCWRTLEQSIRI